MYMTETIAQIAGPYLILTGIGFLLSSDFYLKMILDQTRTDRVTVNLSGAVHFIVGMVVLVNHFRWSSAFEGAVTMVGVAAVLKGSGLIALPKAMMKSPSMKKSGVVLSAVGFLAAGFYLSVVGFRPHLLSVL
jgi:uncharacterized membrane protein